jgi:hypothetical protein
MGTEAESPASTLGLFDIWVRGDKLTGFDVIDMGKCAPHTISFFLE